MSSFPLMAILALHIFTWESVKAYEQITQITDMPLKIADGLFWDATKNCFYFVDIKGSTVQKYVPETGAYTSAKVGNEEVSFVIPIEGNTNEFVISYGTNIARCTWDGVSDTVTNLTIIGGVSDSYPKYRLNDGKISPGGYLITGTMLRCNVEATNQPVAHLYAINNSGVKTLLEGVRLSNGLIWSINGNILYYIDSLTFQIASYNFNHSTAELSNKTTVFDLKENNIDGLPDGMTIDTDGNLWFALNEAGFLLQIDPNKGTILNSVRMPVQNVSDPAFGGPNLTDLYFTSCNYLLSEEFLKLYPLDGDTFVLKGTGARGFPGTPAPSYFSCLKPITNCVNTSGEVTPCS